MIVSYEEYAMESMPFEQPNVAAEPAPASGKALLIGRHRDSVALRRLMDEVRNEDVNRSSVGLTYDRVHNRHNR